MSLGSAARQTLRFISSSLGSLLLQFCVSFGAQHFSNDLNDLHLIDTGELDVHVFGKGSHRGGVVLYFQLGSGAGLNGFGNFFGGSASATGPTIFNDQGLVADVLDLEGVGDGLSLLDLAKIISFGVHLYDRIHFGLGKGAELKKRQQ